MNPPQCVSIRYSERLAEAGIEPSVGSTDDGYDNALAETINGLYMAEAAGGLNLEYMAQPRVPSAVPAGAWNNRSQDSLTRSQIIRT